MNSEDYFFILSIAGLGIGFLHYIVKSCYTQKCDNINVLWGCIRLQRNIQEENKDMEFKIEHGIRDSVEGGNNGIMQPHI